MHPEFWANVQGSFSLQNLLLAQRDYPSLLNLHASGHWLRESLAFWLLLSAAFASVAAASSMLGASWLARRPWHLHAAPGERYGHGERNLIASACLTGSSRALTALPLAAACSWYIRFDRDPNSGAFLAEVPRSFTEYWIWALILALAGLRFGFVAGRRAMRAESTRSGRCFACGYRMNIGSDRCPECGAGVEPASIVPVHPIAWVPRWTFPAMTIVLLIVTTLALVLPVTSHTGSWLRLRVPHFGLHAEDRYPMLELTAGELVWVRWAHVQAYITVRRQESVSNTPGFAPALTRAVIGAWGLDHADTDLSHATFVFQEMGDPLNPKWTIPVETSAGALSVLVNWRGGNSYVVRVPGAEDFVRYRYPIGPIALRTAELARQSK